MHGLNSDRIVVFVNRVDDFADVGYDLAEVIMYVEKKLQVNFPGARIPIVAGSAAWANGALKGDDETLSRLLERSSSRYLADLGLVQPQDLEFDALDDAAARERLRSALFTASGLPAMYRVVADAMGTSQAALTQMQTARWFGDMASASAKAANFELESSRAEPPQAAVRVADERVALERETSVLNEVAANVERSAKHIDAQFTSIIGEEMTSLRQSLQAVVDSHAAKERGRPHRHFGSRTRAAHLDSGRRCAAACARGGVQGLLRPRCGARAGAAGQGGAGIGAAHGPYRARNSDAGRAREAAAAHCAAVDGGTQPVRRPRHRGFLVVFAMERAHQRERLRRADRKL